MSGALRTTPPASPEVPTIRVRYRSQFMTLVDMSSLVLHHTLWTVAGALACYGGGKVSTQDIIRHDEGEPGGPGEASPGRFDAFISCRRLPADEAFVDQLERDLGRHGKKLWIDRAKIEPAAHWEQRITLGIEASKAFIFLLAPESLASEQCMKELGTAAGQHKLIVPVLLREVDRDSVPESLAELNWIAFTPGRDAEAALNQLVRALDDDLEWRDAHTRLTVRAKEWADASADRSFLLRGSDLRSAEEWLAKTAAYRQSPPTDRQHAYILASRKAATRAQRTWQMALSAGLAVSLALAVIALVQRNQAQAQAQARLANSRALAAQAVADLPAPVVIPQPRAPLDAALSTSGDTLAVADGAGAVRVWNIADRRLIHTFKVADINLNLPNRQSVYLPVPLRVALRPDGSAVASGNGDGTVFFWSTTTGRRLAIRTVSAWPVLELTSVPSGQLLAVDWPQAGTGTNPPGAAEVLDFGGNVIAGYQSPELPAPSLNPGAALSPDGQFLYSGSRGLAPAPPGGTLAVYRVFDGAVMRSLRIAATSVSSYTDQFPVQPWSPSGSEIIVGSSLYACDACQPLPAIQSAAAARVALSAPH